MIGRQPGLLPLQRRLQPIVGLINRVHYGNVSATSPDPDLPIRAADFAVGVRPGQYARRMRAGTESSEYSPRWWYLVSVAVAASVVLLIAGALVRVSPALWTVPISAPLGLRFGVRLTLSSSGLRLGGRSYAWDTVELRSTRWGDSLRSRRGAARRLNVFLPLYASRWRGGRLGADIGHWAPHLLAEAQGTSRS